MIGDRGSERDDVVRVTSGEWAVVMLLLLVAAGLRLYALRDLPIGLDQDEIINAIAIRGILAGERPVFITAGWGREPMYVYGVALVVSWVGDMVLGLRLTTAMFSMLFLAVAYVTARRLLGRAIAWITLGWLAVSFWPLMTSRAGERNILLALFACLTIYGFDRALGHQSRAIGWAGVGLALGVTLWTYQSSRIMPLVLVAYAVYLAIAQRALFRAHWKGMLVGLVVGVLVTSPLLIFLVTHPGAETGDFKTHSLRALQQGDWKPIVYAMLGTLALFTVRGEIYWLHNIPGRPIFDGLGSALFYLGWLALLWSTVVKRKAQHILLLLWLSLGLIPAMMTDPPSHHRMTNVMAAVYMLPALGAQMLAQLLDRRISTQASRSMFYLAILLVLASTALTTAHDFYRVWGIAPQVQDLRFARLAQLMRELENNPDRSPVVVRGIYIEDIEPLVPRALSDEPGLAFRWHDGTSQVIPGQVSRARYFDPASGLLERDVDALRRQWLERARLAPEVWLAPPGDALPASVGMPAKRPITFASRVEFLGAEVMPSRLVTYWRVLRDGSPSSTAMFVHLTTPDQIIAQDDRLGFPTHSWRVGDVFSQSFTLSVPQPPPGQAWIELGLYDRATGQRWQIDGAPGVTRVLLTGADVVGQ